MRSEFEIWRDELAGKKTQRSSWWLVLFAVALTAAAIWGLHR